MMPNPPVIFAFMPGDDDALGGRLHALFARISGIFLDASDAGKNSVERFMAAGAPPDELRTAHAVLVAVVTPCFLADAGWRGALEYFLDQRCAFGHGSRLLLLLLEDAGLAVPENDPLGAAFAQLPAVSRPRYRAGMLDGDQGRAIAQSLAGEIASAVANTAKSSSVVWRKGAAEFVASARAPIDGGYIVDTVFADGVKQAAAIERDGALTIIELITMQAARREPPRGMRAHRGALIHAMAAIPESGNALIAEDDALILLALATGARRQIANCDGAVRALAVSADGRVGASAGDGNRAAAWSLANGACLAEYDIGKVPALAATILRDNRTVLIGTAQGEIRAFAGAAPKPRFAVQAHAEDIWAIAASYDDSLIASGGLEGDIAIAAAADGAECRRLFGHWGPVADLRFLTGDAHMPWLVSAGHDATLRLWDASTGECLAGIAAPGPIHTIDLRTGQSGTALIAAGFVPGEDGTGPGYLAAYRIVSGAPRGASA